MGTNLRAKMPTRACIILFSSVAVSTSLPLAQTTAQCQCDAGDFWCSSDGYLRYTYNCSGTREARALYKNISDPDFPSPADCKALTAVCDATTGAHGVPSGNQTCDDKCYDFCWTKDVGDCADMDDEQIFCV